MTTIATEDSHPQIEAPEWHMDFNWWQHPVSAYAKGVADGRQMAREEYEAEWQDVLLEIFGAKTAKEAMDHLIHEAEAVRLRREFDEANRGKS